MTLFRYIYEKKFLFFLCISFLLYGNTLKNGYTIDDQFVTENSYTNKGLKSIKKIFSSYYSENDGKNNYEYRPIVKLSFALEHQLFGVRPWVGHLINLILYALCLFLLFKVLRLIFHNYPLLFSLYIVLIFAVLPLHTEVVASLKNRDVLLCFSFNMLIIIQLDLFFQTKNYLRLILALVLCMLSYLTKYDVLPFLAITPLVLYKKHKFKIAPFLIIIVLFIVGYYLSKTVKHQFLDKTFSERIYKFHENPLFFENTLSLKLSTAFNALGFYLKMLILPTNMSCYYGYHTIDMYNFFSVYAILGIVLFCFMAFYFFKYFKEETPIWYAIIFFGISISMYLNIIRPVPGIIGDRFAFTASIGFAILLAYVLLTYINKNIKAENIQKMNLNFKIVSVVMLLVYSMVTISRNIEWKDRITLYGCDVLKMPESVPLNLLYSNEILVSISKPNSFLTEQNKNEYMSKAAMSLNNVLKIDSVNTTALNNLAFIKQKVYTDFNGAIPYYKKALRIDSTKFEAQFNLAYCLYMTGETKEAKDLIFKIYPTHSGNQSVLDLMSYILVATKEYEIGIQLFKKIAEENPGNNSVNMIIGNFYIALNDMNNAKNYYSIALKNDPENLQIRQIADRLSK
ncbi:MAG: tetratricopeptide repeat protein [Bacteroidota bacterium]